MLDEKDLQAIASLMDTKLTQQKQEIIHEVGAELTRQKQEITHEVGVELTRQKQEIMHEVGAELTQQKQEIMHEVGALIEADITPKFDLLADGQKLIREQMVTRDDLADLESRLDVLEAVTRRNVREIDKLKKAQ